MKLNKTAVVTAAATLVIAGSGAAYAYWTTTGTGTASGTVAASDGTVLGLTTAPITGLVPGGTSTVAISATNPSTTTSYSVTTVTAQPIAITKAAGVTAVCDPDWFTVTVGAGAETVVAKGTTVQLPQTLKVEMANAATNQDGCKGASFSIPLTTP